jgi:hypothetical protein
LREPAVSRILATIWVVDQVAARLRADSRIVLFIPPGELTIIATASKSPA